MLQDPVSSGFRATSFFRKHTDLSNVPQHFGGSTLVVKHLIRDCSPVYTHKHISPSTVLSSNSKTSRGGHLVHLQYPVYLLNGVFRSVGCGWSRAVFAMVIGRNPVSQRSSVKVARVGLRPIRDTRGKNNRRSINRGCKHRKQIRRSNNSHQKQNF